MTDLDRVTFAAFARRFSRIEQWVPSEAPAGFRPIPYRRHGVRGMIRPALPLGVVLLISAALAFVSFGSWLAPIPSPSPSPTPTLTLPPDSAGPEVVLAAYLGALSAGRCDVAEQYIDSPIYRWGDALCGGTFGIRGFSIIGEPHWMGTNRLMFRVLLTTDGRWLGMEADEGEMTIELQQRSSGAWRVVDAWPGPPIPPVLGTPTSLPT